MAIYQHIRPSGTIEAVQVTQAFASSPGTWPAWVTYLWNAVPSDKNSLFLADNASSPPDTILFAVDYEGKVHRVFFGDYLINVNNTSLVYMSQTVFENQFEVV